MLPRDMAVWAIRMFLGREPHSEAEIQLHRRHPGLDSLRIAFARTSEFTSFYHERVTKDHKSRWRDLICLNIFGRVGLPIPFSRHCQRIFKHMI